MSIQHTRPAEIEAASMAIISEELSARGVTLPREQEAVVKRVIHTTADFDYVTSLRFTPDAVSKGIAALQGGAPIITDTNMALAGVSKPSLRTLGGEAFCYMADPAVAAQARERGVTRATVSMEQGAKDHPKGVFAVGNAPTALLSLCELMEQGLRPSLIIAVPVGFVNVVESKERVLSLCQSLGVPCIAALGRKGGSNVAAAICNALLYAATQTLDPHKRW